MVNRRFYAYLVGGIFVFALAIRLFLAFQTDNFVIGDSYFTYRQVELIGQDFFPSYFDDLSYSGRIHVFPPVYYYLLSVFSFVLGTVLTLKIIPNILACTLVIIIYLIVYELTKNRSIALFCSFTSAFIPVFFAGTLNSASVLSFLLPLMFYVLYCFMRIDRKEYFYQFLILSLFLSLTSAVSFLFIFGLLIYLLLIKLEYDIKDRTELDSILFVTFMTLWVNIMLYKRAFLFHSYSLIWQNIPSQVLSSYFQDVDLIASVTSIGLLPLVLGVYAVYRYMFQQRDKRTYLLMAFALSVAFLLWSKMMTLETGLMFLGAILIPLLGQTLNLFFKYIDMTKISAYKNLFWLPLLLLVILSSLLPSVARASLAISDSVSDDEINALEWLKHNSEAGSVVLSTISEGNLVSAIAERKNVADNDFLMIRQSDAVFDDVRQMYVAILKTSALETMTKYDVSYVYFSGRAKTVFNISELKYVDKDCFELVYDSNVKIYKVLCRAGVAR